MNKDFKMKQKKFGEIQNFIKNIQTKQSILIIKIGKRLIMN